MNKTIIIDGKQVHFKATGGTPLRYKQQTGSDYFADMLKLHALSGLAGQKEVPVEVLQKIDFDVFYNIFWALAKTADPELPDPMTWLDSFEEFPIFDLLPELLELVTSNIQSSKKK